MTVDKADEAKRFVDEAFRRHGEDVRRYLRRRLRSADEVEEVSQDAAVRLLRYYHSGIRKLEYLFTVANSALVEHIARKGRLLPTRDPEGAETEGGEDRIHLQLPSLEEAAQASEDFERWLRRLDSWHRRVVRLRAEGFSPQEIAETLGISVSKVKRYLVEARSKLEPEAKKERGPQR
jgi:RNA polymerase sigma factor (sigma-70 family)